LRPRGTYIARKHRSRRRGRGKRSEKSPEKADEGIVGVKKKNNPPKHPLFGSEEALLRKGARPACLLGG